ncbi:MAG: glycosyltransferase family 39 protein, partial [Acidobacteria bacterium]|nr:glycosyltransferase family 39 protein [Acidobacteriota bacterium]
AYSACVVLVFLTVGRFARSGVSMAVAVAFALTPSPFLLTREFEPEIFALLGICLALHALSGVAGSDQDTPRALIAGIGLALAILARPNALPFALLAVLALATRRSRVVTALVAATPPMIAILTLTLRNAILVGVASPAAMDPGAILYGSNNPLSAGFITDGIFVKDAESEIHERPDAGHLFFARIPEAAAGRPLTLNEKAAYWTSRSRAFVRNEPRAALRLLREKLEFAARSYDLFDITLQARELRALRTRHLPTMPWSVFAAAGLLGLGLALRMRPPGGLAAALGLVTFGAFVVVFAPLARYRLPLLPFLAFFTALLLERAVTLFRDGERRRGLLLCAAPLVVAGLLDLPSASRRAHEYVMSGLEVSSFHHIEAIGQRAKGDRDASGLSLARAFATAPFRKFGLLVDVPPPRGRDPRALAADLLLEEERRGALSDQTAFDLGVLLTDLGRDAEAVAVLTPLRGQSFPRLHFGSGEPDLHLGLAAARRGDAAGAEALTRSALEARPGDPWALAQLVALTGEAPAASQLRTYFADVDAEYLTGLALFDLGKRAEAAPHFEKVLSWFPEHSRSRYYAAAARLAAGDRAGAMAHYAKAGRLRGEPFRLRDTMIALLSLENGPEPERVLFAARHLGMHGARDEALAKLALAERLVPGDPRIEVERARLDPR